MKPNVGEKEALYRIGVGVAAAVAALTFVKSKRVAAFLGMVAASGIETGLSRYCPMSELLGIDNAPERNDTPIKSAAKVVSKTLHEPLLH